MSKPMIYCFDIDGTLCDDTNGAYIKAIPHLEVISKLNKLYDDGHTIIIHTARGGTTGIDWLELTQQQLREWNVKYHRLVMGRPAADVYVDDKTIDVEELLNG